MSIQENAQINIPLTRPPLKDMKDNQIIQEEVKEQPKRVNDIPTSISRRPRMVAQTNEIEERKSDSLQISFDELSDANPNIRDIPDKQIAEDLPVQKTPLAKFMDEKEIPGDAGIVVKKEECVNCLEDGK